MQFTKGYLPHQTQQGVGQYTSQSRVPSGPRLGTASLLSDRTRGADSFHRRLDGTLGRSATESNVDSYINRTSTARSSKAGSLRSLPVISPIKVKSSPRSQSITSETRVPTISLNSSFSGPLCRICHTDGSGEQLLSPCYCSGSIGLLHLSCLQRWLGTSNKTVCELCGFQFTLERRPKAFYKYVQNPGTEKDKRQLIFDIVCLCVLTPLTFVTSYLCVHGSTYFPPSQVEFIGLMALTLCLVALYLAWLSVCLKQNLAKWKKWRQFNQEVKLVCKAPNSDNAKTSSNTGMRTTSQSVMKNSNQRATANSKMGTGMKLHSVQIKILTDRTDSSIQPRDLHAARSVEASLPSNRRRHESMPYLTSLHQPLSGSSLARDSSTTSDYRRSDDTSFPSSGLDAIDERELQKVSTWVMTSSEFREGYERSRSPPISSSQNDSYHTAPQSLPSETCQGRDRDTSYSKKLAPSAKRSNEKAIIIDNVNYPSKLPLQFTDAPAEQNRCIWTQPTPKETYL